MTITVGEQHARRNLPHHGDRQRRRHPAEHHGDADGDGATTAQLHDLGLAVVADGPARQSRNLDDHDDHQRRLQQRDHSVGVGSAVGNDGEFQSQPDTSARLGQLDDDHHGGASTPIGTYPITVTGNGGGIQQNTTVTLTVLSSSTWAIGFDFRASSNYVMDPPGDTYVLPSTAYPTTFNGVNFGWTNVSLLQAKES